MRALSDTDLISSVGDCKLYTTPQTSVNVNNQTLQYICSEREGRIAFHRKLKVYKSESGFYVIARGARCYVDNLMHKWFLK